MERVCKNWQEGVRIIKQGVFWPDFSFTRDDHEKVVLTGGRLGQVLHDVPVALNQLLHLSLCVAVIFLSLVLIFTLAVLLISILFPVFLLFGPILKNVLCFVVLLLSLIKKYIYTSPFELPLHTRCLRVVCPSHRRSWPDPSTSGTPSIGRTRWTESERFLWSGCCGHKTWESVFQITLQCSWVTEILSPKSHSSILQSSSVMHYSWF